MQAATYLASAIDGRPFVLAWAVAVLTCTIGILFIRSGAIGPPGSRSPRGLFAVGLAIGAVLAVVFPLALPGPVELPGLVITVIIGSAVVAAVFAYAGGNM